MLLITACSEGTDTVSEQEDTDDTPRYSQGILVLVQDSSRDALQKRSPYFSLTTFSIREPVTLDEVRQQSLASYSLSQERETCVSGTDAPLPDDTFGVGRVDYIDAGEVVTVSSDGNSVLEIAAADTGVYVLNSGDPGEQFPANMTIDVPGGTLPATARIAVPSVPDISGPNEDGMGYVGGNVLMWNAYLGTTLPAWIFVNGGNTVCVVNDDGEFLLPDEVTFTDRLSMTRHALAVDVIDTTLIVVLRTKVWN